MPSLFFDNGSLTEKKISYTKCYLNTSLARTYVKAYNKRKEKEYLTILKYNINSLIRGYKKKDKRKKTKEKKKKKDYKIILRYPSKTR